MICPNCGTELEDGSLDCSVCGYEFEYEEADESDYEAESSEGIECPYCGSVIEAGSAICPVCQSELETNEEDIAVNEEAQPVTTGEAAVIKSSKTPIIVIASILAAAAIGVGVYAFASQNKEADNIVQDNGVSSEAETIGGSESAESEHTETEATTTASSETTTTSSTTTSSTTAESTTTSKTTSETTTTKATPTTKSTTTTTTATVENNLVQPQPASRLVSSKKMYVNTNSSNLNIRYGPDSGYSTISGSSGIPKGTYVEVIAEEYDGNGTLWAFINYNGQNAWCMEQYLAEGASTNSAFANDLIHFTITDITVKYFNEVYDKEQMTTGQSWIWGYKNTTVFPYYEFGFTYDENSADQIGWYLYQRQTPDVIHVSPGGYINKDIKIGMTYNELKDKLHFEGVQATGSTYSWTAYAMIDGVKWGIQFDIPTADKKKLEEMHSQQFIDLDHPFPVFDISDINPKSDLGYYIRSFQN